MTGQDADIAPLDDRLPLSLQVRLNSHTLEKWTHAELVAEVRRLRAMPDRKSAFENLRDHLAHTDRIHSVEVENEKLRGYVDDLEGACQSLASAFCNAKRELHRRGRA